MAPSQDERIKALKARREAFRMEVDELKSVVISPEAASHSRELTIRLEELHSEYTLFTKYQVELDTYDETGDLLRDRVALKSFYMQTRARALELTTPAISAQITQSRDILSPYSQLESVDLDVQLPKMNLPTFSGNCEEWPGLANQFRSGVHDKPRLTDAKKLTYLRSCLEGESLRDIDALNNSPANYAIAWAILEKRYNQPAVIVATHLKALFEIQTLNRPAPRELRSFLGNIEAHYRALQPLQQPSADTVLIYLFMSKVDNETSLKWREHTKNDTFPTLETLFEFLHERCRIIEPISSTQSQATPPKPNGSYRNQTHPRVTNRMNFREHHPPPAHVLTMQLTASCNLCNENHYTQQCETLTRLSITDRINLVNSRNLCTNCLGSNHTINACRSTTCRRCHQKHHTLSHLDTRIATPLTSLTTHVDTPFISETFLATAVVKLTDDAGQTHLCRVLLDSCSQAHLLTYKFFKKVQLTSERISIPLSGTNNMVSAINSQTRANIKSKFNNFSRSLTFLLVNKVSQNVPTTPINRSSLTIPQNLPLADPQFHQSAEIDGLIGAQLFWDLLSIGCIKLADTDTKLHKTKLGWVIVGENISQPRQTTITCNVITNSLEQQLSKFWELEERSTKKHLSLEERLCEAHYVKNTSRDPISGRYSVRLPFKENVSELGESYTLAMKRFLSLERQLDRNPHIKIQYSAFLKEYLQLGHMSRADSSSRDGYFLPHHAVSKEGSLTTKIRVVFDASARTTTGVSLNDTLMTGPTIQDDLFSLVTRFRTHQYVLTADIAKMYRQISLDTAHRQYHKILWREEHRHPIQTFILNTVTYGTASAPFLAIRTLQQLAEDEGTDFPLASQALLNDFYVDDLLSGAHTFSQAENLRDQLIALTAKAGLQLRQWASNDARLIEPLRNPQDESMTLTLTDNKKTVGLFWHPQRDTIGYTVKEYAPRTKVTKRAILSRIAQLFDPLGLLGPTIVRAKLIMQELWKISVHWDESVPANIHTAWNEFQNQLPALQSFSVPRKIVCSQTVSTELHGFCDASERAYGACLFLRSTNMHGAHTVRLICSKSRVAPLKVQSLPRLELCAAILLISLYRPVTQSLKIPIDAVNLWTDSMITLHWIRTPPHTLKQFVANRVSEIQQHSHANQWRHVPSSENPADILSRGSSPVDLINCKLWINGPPWLAKETQNWPLTKLDPVAIPEQRSVTILQITARTPVEYPILRRFSSFTTLIRVLAYCYRFFHITHHKTKYTDQLSTNELHKAHILAISLTQNETFRDEQTQLKEGRINNYKGRLAPLKPFIDSDGLIRVGGRLVNSALTYDIKHPLLLPNNHPITTLIINQYHRSHGHTGAQTTLNILRQKYWPINGKMQVKSALRRCIICLRASPTIPNYEMGNLPKHRVTYTRPFLTTGVDYCGPFFIKAQKLRNTKRVKCYVAIFVCFATKAIHLELVSDLTTDAFIAALRRFFARRGKSKDIYSDNGTNFVGANRELKEIYKLTQSETHNKLVKHYLVDNDINWHFNPPRAPHFGGLWEAAVKSLKRHTTRLLHHTTLTYEAFTTCLAEMEAILNSRPITPLSSDPSDLNALTPGHFLIGDAITSIPERDFTDTNPGRLSNWQHTQQIRQHFWSRWHREYLNELTVRQKWHRHQDINIREGTLVILKEDNVPPLCWPLGRISSVHPGEDGTIRVVTVKTAQGTYKRATKRVAPLPIT